MKKNYTLIITTILLLTCLVPHTWAECYLVNDATEYSKGGVSSGVVHTYTFNSTAPAAMLYFNARVNTGAFGSNQNCDFTIQEYTDTWHDVTTITASSTDAQYSCALSRNATQVRFDISYHTYKRFVSNVKVTQATYVESSANPVDCGTVAVGGSSTDTKFVVNWSNVNPLTLSLDSITNFSISPMQIASSTCNYGSQEITVDFHPTSKGKKTATVTISNADNSEWAAITLNGIGDSIPQYISWWDESVTMLSRGDIIDSPFVQASSGLAFTELRSTDTSVLKIENGQLIAVAAGTADIIAYQAGDAKYAEARDTLHLEVTNLLTQKISWTQGLNFKWGDAATTLTATSSVGLPITYELVDNASNVVSLSGNVLTISTSNVGTATIKAVQAGDAIYAGTSYTRTIRVRDPNASCLDEPFALDDMNTYSLNTIQKGPEMVLDGWPDKLTFQAKRASLSANYFFVQQYLNGSWQDVLNPSLTTSYATYTCSLNRNATKIRFITKTGATLTKNYKNVQVTRAHFVEANVSSLNIEAQYGTTTTKTVRVNYSNIQDIVTTEIVSGNDEFRVTPATIGNDCGDYGTIDVQVIYTPSAIASDSETLRIGNEKDGLYLPKIDRYSNEALALFSKILELNDSTFAEINAQAAYRLACYYVNPNQIIKPNMAKGKKYLEQSKKWAELSNDTTLLFKIKQSLETFK